MLSLLGCATTASNTQIGCAAGAIVGVMIGQKLDKDAGAFVGGAIGTIVGCGIGHYLDEREKKIAELAKVNAMDVSFERVSVDKDNTASFSRNNTEEVLSSAVAVSSEQPLFDPNKSTISDKVQLDKLRNFLKGYLSTIDPNSNIYVVGHTDASGSPEFNQILSEQRALFIAGQLVELGAKPERLFYEGVGQSQPVASNETLAGRAKNRRFELHDVFSADTAKAVSVSQVATISNAKKQRLSNVINDTSTRVNPKVLAVAVPKDVKAKPTVKANKVVQAKPKDPLGLGGVHIDKFKVDVLAQLGVPKYESSLFSKAYANELPMPSCAYAEPVVTSTLKSFNGQKIRSSSTSNSLPNLYGTMWWSKVNNTGITLGPVGIEKESMQPTKQPSFSFYLNYAGGNVAPTYQVPVSIETYRGDNAVLVRMYAKDADSPFRCSDVVFSIKGDAVTKTTGLIYADNGQLFGREMQLSLVRPK